MRREALSSLYARSPRAVSLEGTTPGLIDIDVCLLVRGLSSLSSAAAERRTANRGREHYELRIIGKPQRGLDMGNA